MKHLLDIHTHSDPSGLLNAAPADILNPDLLYSLGIHPWKTDISTDADIRQLTLKAAAPNVMAIGECGLDKNRGGDLNAQIELFRLQAQLGETLKKPLIIHCVKSFDTLIALKKEINPSQPWIVHGFRGKPELAHQLAEAGFYISIGEKFNPAAVKNIPSDRLLAETDESSMEIEEIIRNISSARVEKYEITLGHIIANLSAILPKFVKPQ